MYSFWEDKPIKVNYDKKIEPRKILDNDNLLNYLKDDLDHIKERLENFPKNLKYTLHFSEMLSVDEKMEIIDFINKHYFNKYDYFILSYNYDLFNFFFREAVLIKFYIEDQQIGMIIGKKKHINIKGAAFNCFEGNFLCLAEKFRNMHISSYMMDILAKISVEKYNINICYYTIHKEIKSRSFCKKIMNYIPVNIENLYDINFFSNRYPIETFKKSYENCHDTRLEILTQNIIYINSGLVKKVGGGELLNSLANLEDIINKKKLVKMINDYHEKKYDIFDYISEDEFSKMLMNKAFHHFMLVDNNDITDYICFFRLDYTNNTNNQILKNGFLFLNVFDMKDSVFDMKDDVFDMKDNVFEYKIKKSLILKSIIKYCRENLIIDMILSPCVFDDIKMLRDNSSFNYYMYNMEMPYIENELNGMVTI